MARSRTLDFVTWYGLPARAVVGLDGRHLVRAGPFTLPHPGIVNRFLRSAEDPDASLMLAALHERGHLETMPLAMPLAMLLSAIRCWFVWRRTQLGTASWSTTRAVVDLLMVHVVWEGLAETWVITRSGATYRWPAAVRAASFWLAVSAACLWLLRTAASAPPYRLEGGATGTRPARLVNRVADNQPRETGGPG